MFIQSSYTSLCSGDQLKNVASQERKGPTVLSATWAQSQTPLVLRQHREEARAEVWPLGHGKPATLTSTLTPKPLQDSWGHPRSEHVDDIYCAVEITAPSVIS